jgi:3-phosphoshikimate 1-carboxyvinyltransferase
VIGEFADELEVLGGRELGGTVTVPGDKSISHRALIFGTLAGGTSRVRGLSDGEDVGRTLRAMGDLGALISEAGDPEAREREIQIEGSPEMCRPPGPLGCGNSGTTMRLLAGVVAGRGWPVRMEGDRSLSGRPMDRIAEPLRLMGVEVNGRSERCLPPIVLNGDGLQGIEFSPRQASSQVKSCVLLAGLRASGETVVREPVATRRHTEEFLELCGADFDEESDGPAHVVKIRASELSPFELSVPGDPSQAAFWAVAGCIVAGSEIRIPGVYLGKERRGFVDVLERMGADLSETAADGGSVVTADLVVRAGGLVATVVEASEITGLDEVPVLAVAAALADGTTRFRNISELRVKESDRLSAIVAMLTAFGGWAEADGEDLVIQGVDHLEPAAVDSKGDHRIAMAAAVAAMTAVGDGPSVIGGWGSVATSYRGFADDLRELGGVAH